MLSSKTDRGRKLAERGNLSLGQDVVKLLKTQDIAYLQCMLQKTQKAIQRLEQNFVLGKGASVDVLGDPERSGRSRHLVLVETPQAQRQYESAMTTQNGAGRPKFLVHSDNEEYEDIDAEGDVPVPQNEGLSEQEALAAKSQNKVRKKKRSEQETSKRRLVALRVREKDLQNAVEEVQHQRARMSNSVGGLTKNGLKWRTRERKR